MDFTIPEWTSTLLICTLLMVLYQYANRNFSYWKTRNVPYVKPLPFIGNFWDIITMKLAIGHYLEKLYNQLNVPYFGIWAFNKPILVVSDPELIKDILIRDFQYFSDRCIVANEKADSLAANFLFIAKTPMWKEIRTKVSPFFTSGKLKIMLNLINNSATDLVDYIDKNCVNHNSDDAKELAAKFTTDVITSTAFGLEANCFKYEDAQFRVLGKKMFDYDFINSLRTNCYLFSPFLVGALKLTFFTVEVNNFLRKTFWRTIKEREVTGMKRNDLIDSIIEWKNLETTKDEFKFEGDRVVAQPVQIFVAGFETTSTTIAFALYELALNKNVQNKLRNEIRTRIKSNEEIDYDTIKNMDYLNNVISESLRKYPSVPFLDRRCVKDYKLPNSDLIIEKGTPVYIPMLGLHYNPKYFPEPEKFDPDRFNKENNLSRCQFTYFPFGDGPHNCIGKRFALLITKIVLIRVLSNFEVIRSDDTPVPVIYDPKSFVLKSIGGLPIKFRKLALNID